MFGLGLPEIVVIVLAIGVLLFGGKKIVELSRSLGRASGEFKKGKQEIERELKESEASVTAPEASGDTASQTTTESENTEVKS